MGTGKCGRYLNTKGSSRSVSDFALVHSSEGKFTQPSRRGDKLRLVNGRHGQAGMDLLDKYGIQYNIIKTYSYGVRIGNIPSHKNKMKKSGTGQAWFPSYWKNKDIRKTGEHVANMKQNRYIPDGQACFGNYKGVRVGVIRTNGKISTVFPDINQ